MVNNILNEIENQGRAATWGQYEKWKVEKGIEDKMIDTKSQAPAKGDFVKIVPIEITPAIGVLAPMALTVKGYSPKKQDKHYSVADLVDLYGQIYSLVINKRSKKLIKTDLEFLLYNQPINLLTNTEENVLELLSKLTKIAEKI